MQSSALAHSVESTIWLSVMGDLSTFWADRQAETRNYGFIAELIRPRVELGVTIEIC